ncbi:uncharacterized protein L969DRAFT_90830 [Mixia osmundae IAM 14324]|uniref:Ribosomal protein S11 n=1 Tax=Mixia osmundae (strain CBS 9802 / IAM 14324 / JCM 22182 / KY 12970) TaxID=764103 RepID=G7DWB0_MIXOS|nr:uncharacterized protein L969DRAFT_90830 [Mixia osmundae IAM 14324]KEI36502.1 hypothetical protein L969DRAFT_90830 [Mixia osmundae IAM 14324]GAA94798.1 hypothetical protein E5Q_01452 [Mixia osmundae IAM 14324]
MQRATQLGRRHFASTARRRADGSATDPAAAPAETTKETIGIDLDLFRRLASQPASAPARRASQPGRDLQPSSQPNTPSLNPFSFGGRGLSRARAPYTLHVHSTSNNTILTFSVSDKHSRSWSKDSYGSSYSSLGALSSYAVAPPPPGVIASAGSSTQSQQEKPSLPGQPVFTVTAGQLGFKKGQRGGYEAGTQTSQKMFSLIDGLIQNKGMDAIKGAKGQWKTKRAPPTSIEVSYSGFGQGRDAVHAAMLTEPGNRVRELVTRVIDATPIKIGGVRPRKRRIL